MIGVAIVLWFLPQPSNDRIWVANQAVLPSAEFDDNLVHVRNIRNTTYRSTTDYTTAYYDKIAVAARVLYEKVRAAGWTRTPDPRDSPNEASLRFRLGETDCLFNVYQGILLGTDSEIEVTNAVETRPGDELYHVLVLCVPAMEARRARRARRAVGR